MSRPEDGGHDPRTGAYAVLVDGAGRILLALLNLEAVPAWTLPGGGVEPGETPEQAAVREVREETGYDVELERLLGEDALTVPAGERIDGGPRALRVTASSSRHGSSAAS